MTKKIRVFELAKNLGLSSKALLEKLELFGIRGLSHMSVLTAEQAEKVELAIAREQEEEKRKGEKVTTRIEQREEGAIAVEERRIKPTIIRRRMSAVPEAPPQEESEKEAAEVEKIGAAVAEPLGEEPQIAEKREQGPSTPDAREEERKLQIKALLEEERKELRKIQRRKKERKGEGAELGEVEAPAVERRTFVPRVKTPAPLRRPPQKTLITVPKAHKRVVRMEETILARELARRLGVKASKFAAKMRDLGLEQAIDDKIDFETATILAAEYRYQVQTVKFSEEELLKGKEEKKGARLKRAPVITVMGHVDHGKTSLLDVIRKTHVAAGEKGGITQHVGAYHIEVGGNPITFIDTPGHEAFTAMRARGAMCTDIVVLVVASDDGVMPQTIEAIDHARAANVPVMVALNKIDKPEANPERVKQELAKHGLLPEEWGGETIFCPLSAKTGKGVDTLLEMILLQADVLELKGDPTCLASGVILESRLDKGRGPAVDVIIREGTLHVGDIAIAGKEFGRVRAMVNDRGQNVKEVALGMPIEILGLSGVPEAGIRFQVVENEKVASQIIGARREEGRIKGEVREKVTLESLSEFFKEQKLEELKLVLKADVQGSVEALYDAIQKCQTEEVKINILHTGVGFINESDIQLAKASDAIVVGFHVKTDSKSRMLAEREGVEVRIYDIIYEAVEDLEKAVRGLLKPIYRTELIGKSEVRAVFHVSKVGAVAGSYVTEGKVRRGCKAKVIREGELIYEGNIISLKRFKEDVREVAQGYECGISIENFEDFKEGDTIEAYQVIEEKRA